MGKTTRQCGSCTACCEGWINADINGVKLGPGNPCQHCTKQGCAIYEERPVVPCVNFKCGWLMDESPLPANMNPVECGVIVLLGRKWKGIPCVFALPTGKTVPGETLDWLMAYARENKIPLVFTENVFEDGKFVSRHDTGYGPPVFIQAVKNAITDEDIFMM